MLVKKNLASLKIFKAPNYEVSVELRGLEHNIDRYVEKYDLDINPPFQRGHVWSDAQRIAFMEYFIQGGAISPINFNHPNWQRSLEGTMTLVDGKQRLTTFILFLNNTLPVFGGHYRDDVMKTINIDRYNVKFAVNNLSEAEAVEWYISMNAGGTPHTVEEIEVAKRYLNELNQKQGLIK
jgi:hypothetical protein